MPFAETTAAEKCTSHDQFADLVARIHPKHSPAYSKNLHLWLKAQGRAGDTLFKAREGSRLADTYGADATFIGQPYCDYEGDADFSGALLIQVLCMGRSVVRSCFAGAAVHAVESEDFWTRYEKVGRCAIDPEHKLHFRDDKHRFHQVDGQQTCKWCTAPAAARSGDHQ